MKFEKLLEKYRKVCRELEVARDTYDDQERTISGLRQNIQVLQDRADSAARILTRAPFEGEGSRGVLMSREVADKIASAPDQASEGPRMASPMPENKVPDFSDRIACPLCGHPVKR
jgi:hypothetical protein